MRPIAAVVGLAVFVAGVLVLRAETLSTHVDTPPGSRTEVVIDAATKNAEPSATVPELAEALVLTCRLQVAAELIDEELREIEPSTFAFALTPALDESDRRQLIGCLEDARVDHLQADVVRLVDRLP